MAERFFDRAGSLYVVLFDPHEGHWQNVIPAASAAQYATLAGLARDHDARSQMTGNAFLHLLLTRTITDPVIPPTPSETSEDSSSSHSDRMDVDASEPGPEFANQLRFLQRHNAENISVSQPQIQQASEGASI